MSLLPVALAVWLANSKSRPPSRVRLKKGERSSAAPPAPFIYSPPARRLSEFHSASIFWDLLAPQTLLSWKRSSRSTSSSRWSTRARHSPLKGPPQTPLSTSDRARLPQPDSLRPARVTAVAADMAHLHSSVQTGPRPVSCLRHRRRRRSSTLRWVDRGHLPPRRFRRCAAAAMPRTRCLLGHRLTSSLPLLPRSWPLCRPQVPLRGRGGRR